MHLDQQNQYWENGHITESNVYMLIKIPILQKDRKINPKVHLEAQKTLKSVNNPEQKEQ
jgi:hypothetical protein